MKENDIEKCFDKQLSEISNEKKTKLFDNHASIELKSYVNKRVENARKNFASIVNKNQNEEYVKQFFNNIVLDNDSILIEESNSTDISAQNKDTVVCEEDLKKKSNRKSMQPNMKAHCFYDNNKKDSLNEFYKIILKPKSYENN